MSFTMKRNSFKDDQLRVNVAEIAAWIPRVLPARDGEDEEARVVDPDEEFDARDVDDFFERLSDGVDLCRLVERVSPASSWEDGADGPTPDVRCPHNPRAKRGSFPARDNVAKFLDACKRLGLRELTLFTTEDLMARKNDARVVGVLMDLARLGAENGVEAPLIVQFERELDGAQESDSEDEEEETFVAGQFGLEAAELDAVRRVFNALTEGDAAVTTQAALVAALDADDEVRRLRAERAEFDRLLAAAAASATDEVGALDELLNFVKKQDKLEGGGGAAAGGEGVAEVPKAAGMALVRPRGQSLGQRKYTFAHLPYLPVAGNEIDEALALVANTNQLDIRIRRIALRSKKRGKQLEGAYRVGSGSQPKVFLRLVRGLLMVRVANKWESAVTFLQRKMGEEFAA